jgi:AraC-like DNA-binding protein
MAVIAGRRRVAALSARISEVLTPTRPAREHFRMPTIKALQCISRHATAPSVESVAAAVGLSARHLTRLFRADTGLSLKSYLLRVRVALAKERLRETDAKVEVVAEEVGLCDASHMARLFRRFEGMTPAAYRRPASREMSGMS